MSEKSNKIPQKATLNALQVDACVMLAQGMSITDVSRRLNVNRCTLYRWLEIDSFQERLDEEIDEYKMELKSMGFLAHRLALETIIETLASKDVDSVKVAMWVLDGSLNTLARLFKEKLCK